MPFDFGDVVLVPFPFTDQSSSKQRPAVTVSQRAYANARPRHLRVDLWEVRSSLNNRIARVIFAVEGNTMYLLHGFIKTTRSTPPADLELAQRRWKQIKP